MTTDGTPISDTVAEVTAQIAKASHLPVTVLAAAPAGADRKQIDEDLNEKMNALKLEGIACDGLVIEKTPDQAIIDAAQSSGADLVVIGNDQRKGLTRKIAGQTTDRVVGGLTCAVLVVKRAPEPDTLVAAVRKQS